MLAILAMLGPEWAPCGLRVVALLASPTLRAVANAWSGRDGKAGALAEPESLVLGEPVWVVVSRSGLSMTAATGVQSRV